MICYRNITDEVIEDKIIGERFQPGQDYWVRDEVKPDFLLRGCKELSETEKIELVKTDYLLNDPRFVVVKEMVYKEPEKPSDAKTHYHVTWIETTINDEKVIEEMKASYLASLEVKP